MHKPSAVWLMNTMRRKIVARSKRTVGREIWYWPVLTPSDLICDLNIPNNCALRSMDKNQHAKSLKSLADNQRWLDEHKMQILHHGDMPISAQTPKEENEDQQQQ